MHTVWERSKGCEEAGCSPAHGARSNERRGSPRTKDCDSSEAEIGGRRSSSRRFWKQSKRRHGSNGTPRVGFGAAFVRRCRKSTSPSHRFVDSFESGKFNCDWSARRRSFRSPTFGVEKRRWTGMKLTRISAESESWPTYFACAAWPVAELSIAPSRTPANKRFWKHMKRRLSISVEYSRLSVTTT